MGNSLEILEWDKWDDLILLELDTFLQIFSWSSPSSPIKIESPLI